MPGKEGNSTFVAKSVAAPEQSNGTTQEAAQPILESLEVDQKKVLAIDLYIEQVVTERIESPQELEARLAGQRASADSNYLGNPENRNYFRRNNGEVVRVGRDETPGTNNPEEKLLLEALLKEQLDSKAELERAKKETNSLQVQTARIFARAVESVAEAEARFVGRRSADSNYLGNPENGNYFRRDNGDIVRLGSSETPILNDPEQKVILLELVGQLANINSEKLIAEQQKQKFKIYEAQIIGGRIEGVEELESRFAGRRAAADTNYLANPDTGNYFRRSNGDLVRLGSSETPGLKNEEQKAILKDLFVILKDEKIPEEVRKGAQRYLQSKDALDFARLEILLGDQDINLQKQVLGSIKAYEKTARLIEFKDEFYKTFTSNPDYKQQIILLNSFAPQDAVEIQLIGELGVQVQAVKRLKVVNDFTTALATPNRDFTQVLTMLAELNKPGSSKEDKRAAFTLAKALTKLELATYRDEIRKKIRPSNNPEEVYRFISGLPIRPSSGPKDYVDTYTTLRNNAAFCFMGFEKINRLRELNQIRQNFTTKPVQEVLQQISNLRDETQEEFALKSELLARYKKYIATERPQDFDQNFREGLATAIEMKLQMQFIKPELGQNKKAFRFIRERFVSTIFPLAESYKEDPRTSEDIGKYLYGSDGKSSPRVQFVQRLRELEKVRPLTDVEKAYIQSVELLTLFNPYFVGVATANFGVTNAFLRHHFESLSKKTVEGIKDGDYFPALMIGTGPDGLAALGEMVRNNPDLAQQILTVDAGSQPGGPFAVPEGAAWELNSANERGKLGYILPDAPGPDEIKTVRAYGSPLRRYPGERRKGLDIRQGSINTTVDYLPTPDGISNARYPTNEELQCVLALQAAVLTKNLALNTEVLSVEPNPNLEEKGDKIVTLRVTETLSDGTASERIVRVKTDGVFNSTGLGEKSYGFKLEGSRAANVIQQTSSPDLKRFPPVSTTLEAFKALANRNEERFPPGETIVIYGSGNSTDTLVEYIGNLFQGDNPMVRNVRKIYIVATGELSARPRYAAINDIKAREGRNQGNLIEIVSAKVNDIDFASQDGEPTERQLVIYDAENKIINDSRGNPIKADSVIAATGFRPQLQKIFESYVGDKPLRGENSALKPLTLPTNPDVAVGEYFETDPTILILGTASNPAFNLQKFAQLPKEAREALLRNGAENAVAIGFRAPDSQAAMNIFLNSLDTNVVIVEEKPKKRIPIEGTEDGSKTRIISSISFGDNGPRIPNNIDQEDQLLSPLLSYLLGNNLGLDKKFTGDLNFSLQYDGGDFKLSYEGGALERVSEEFLSELATAVSDRTFQTYSASLLNKRRRNKKLNLSVGFLNGEIDPRQTFVEA